MPLFEAADEVTRTRAAVHALLLLPPGQVPAAVLESADFAAADWQALRGIAAASWQSPPGSAAFADSAARALAHLPLPADAALRGALRSCLHDPEPHDAYFRIARTDCAPGLAYLRGLVGGLVVHLDEAAGADEAAAYGIVSRALQTLWCEALGVPVPDTLRGTPAGADERPPMRHLCRDPVRRWLRGHQVFAVLTQGLIWSFHQLARAAAAGAEADTVRAMGRLRLLFDASAAAFRFAADFDPLHYTVTIRPSMCEPHVPKGFSGTLSSDHGHLVSLMAGMRPVLAELKSLHPAPHAAMMQALGGLYDDHKLVCECFDGGAKASLRGEGRAGAPTGVEMLERFKTQRLKMVG